jgi:hypothetical protein
VLGRVRAAWVGAILLGCPQGLKDDFSIVRNDASAPPDDFPTVRNDASAPPHAVDCAPFDACEGICVDVDSDALHCGACGAAVEAEEICSRGMAISADVGCGTRLLCERGCVDPLNHVFHCGTCGVSCKPGARCMMGRCECGAGTRDCGSECRGCCSSRDCPMDRTCSDGECLLICEAPRVGCMDRCVDLQTEPKHCGRCGNDCGPMVSCLGGTCMRP